MRKKNLVDIRKLAIYNPKSRQEELQKIRRDSATYVDLQTKYQ